MADATNGQARRLLFLHAQTGLHPGSGTALGVVDLPVQRERHTHWPVIPGSTLKGILRDACREQAAQKPEHSEREEEGRRLTRRDVANRHDADLVAAFGPHTQKASDHAGALSITDARILAFPVRSLRGVFAWVTCPEVLGRLQRDLRVLAGDQNPKGCFSLNPEPGGEKAICSRESPLLVEGKLILEEFEFTWLAEAHGVANWIADHAVSDDFTRERIKSHLVVLNNDDFTHFVRHATEVVARVGLDYDHKTVKSGALFYEEFLPPETLFYAVVIASASRKENYAKSGPEILRYLNDKLPHVLQIGGDETIGKGLCAVRLSDGHGGAA